jgi:alpha-1,4-galacturonosyltransferase
LCSEIVAHELFVELPLRKAGEHKSRVLSEVTVAADGTEKIELVTRREAHHGGSVSADLDENKKTIRSEEQSSSKVSGF